MQEHWQVFGPPVYVAVAGYLGITKARKRKGATPARPGMPAPPESPERAAPASPDLTNPRARIAALKADFLAAGGARK